MTIEIIREAMELAAITGNIQEVKIKTAIVVIGPNGPTDIQTEHGRNVEDAINIVFALLAEDRQSKK